MIMIHRLPRRILNKIAFEPNTGCWLWMGALNNRKYGNVRRGRADEGHAGAHRLVFEIMVGPIEKPTLDHQCLMVSCVNPDHLKPATVDEQYDRRRRRSHCSRGHEYTVANTGWYVSKIRKNKYRRCKACDADRYQRGGANAVDKERP